MAISLTKFTEDGDLQCPHCGVRTITPIAWNPYNGNQEPLEVVPGEFKCKWCKQFSTVVAQVAEAHNKFWFDKD